MSEEISETPNKLSAANSMYAQIYRFDDIKKKAHLHASHSNNFLWNLELDNIWKEIAPDLPQKYGGKDKQAVQDIYNKMKDINKKILSTYPLITGSIDSGFNKPSKERLEKISLQYQYLVEKEVYLGEIYNDLGKGTKWADEDADSM